MSEEVVKANENRNGMSGAKNYARRAVTPPVDVFENSDEVLVIADVPGVGSDAVDVRIENDTLTLETRRPTADDGSPAVSREYDEVDYARSFRIPAGIDTSNITAETKKGTLIVHLPKAAAARPRKIAVRTA